MPNKIAIKTTGYRTDTAENYLLDAGAIFVNPSIETTTKEIHAETMGATVGGLKLNINVELRQPEVDGLLVNVKGNDVINSIEATLEGTFKEFATDTIGNAIHGDSQDATDLIGYKIIKGRNKISDSDYKDVLFVGTISGQQKPMVIWLKNCINTAGFSIETADKAESGIPFKFEARADKDKPTDYQGIYTLYVPNQTITSGLTITSTAGTNSGESHIVVAPTKGATNKYFVKVAQTVDAPFVGDLIGEGFIDWNGTADITGETGHQILVVETDSHDKALKSGIGTITSKA